MAGVPGPSGAEGLERPALPGEWVEGRGPVGGVELLRARFQGRAFARHRHDTYGICVTEAGVQVFDYRGQVERSLPGQVTVLHPDELHDGRAGAETAFGYRIVYVDPARIAAAVRTLRGRSGPLPFVREAVGAHPALASAVSFAFAAHPEPLALDALVLRLAEGLLEGSEGPHAAPGFNGGLDHPALERGREFLDGAAAVVRSDELEGITGVTRYEFARQFRAAYGTSPYRYSVMRRLERARAGLRDGAPLADLALTAGFADQAHFTRMFKSAYGMTPGRYARLCEAGPG
jgi:AraC-like DNA-binding protein